MGIPRRKFLAGLGAAAAAAPLRAHAQVGPDLPFVAFLASGGAEAPQVPPFLRGMEELGYAQGRDYTFEARYGGGVRDRLPALAAELIALGPTVIVGNAEPAMLELARQTTTIPIVSPTISEQNIETMVGDFTRPFRNVTGVYADILTVFGKQFEISKDFVPDGTRVGVLMDGQLFNPAVTRDRAIAAAALLGQEVVFAVGLRPEEMPLAFQELVGADVDAVVVAPSPLSLSINRLIVQSAADAGVATFYPLPSFVRAGGLASSGIDGGAHCHRAAYYVDKILKGAQPGDLPVEQSSFYTVAVNVNTARALGIDIPAIIFAKAGVVIE